MPPTLLFILLLILTFAIAFYFLRPTKTESAVQQHLEEIKSQKLVSTIERMIGKPVPEEDKKYLVRGPEEIDLVNSGLEEAMVDVVAIWLTVGGVMLAIVVSVGLLRK